jgi:Arc/MetJ-type ribon-helix-helix transcriptional regulator
MTEKARLSVTIDPKLVAIAQQAVADGRAASTSAWINEAMARYAEHEQRLQAVDHFVEAFEATHGEISDDEMRAARRRVAARATVVRGRPAG